MRTLETRMLLDAEKPFEVDDAAIARFVVVGRGEVETFAEARAFDSSTELSLPSGNVDSDESLKFSIRFYINRGLIVVLVRDDAAPRAVVTDLISRIVDEVRDKALRQRGGFGDDARWVVVRMLRSRVREIEDSVRRALVDEHISPQDYAALREYPLRLARVERLVSTLPRQSSRVMWCSCSSGTASAAQAAAGSSSTSS